MELAGHPLQLKELDGRFAKDRARVIKQKFPFIKAS